MMRNVIIFYSLACCEILMYLYNLTGLSPLSSVKTTFKSLKQNIKIIKSPLYSIVSKPVASCFHFHSVQFISCLDRIQL